MITAIVPYYNSGKTIGRAISSLLAQTHLPEEILIINDGSNTAHTEIVLNLEQEHNLVQVIHQKNKGLPGARNTGIRESKGEYLLMLDADDTFEPSFLREAFHIMSTQPKVAVVTCGVARIINNTVKYTYVPTKLNLSDCLLDNIAPACALFKKEALMEIGGYDNSFTSGFEDWDLNIRLLENEFTFQVIPEILFNYYDTEGSLLKETYKQDLFLRKLLLTKHRELYTKHIEIFVEKINYQQKKIARETNKIRASIDFKVGSILLKPLRWMKQFFK